MNKHNLKNNGKTHYGKNGGDFFGMYFFWAPKSLKMVITAMKLKDAYSLEGKL